MATKLSQWCGCNSSVLCLHIFILGLVPYHLQPNHKLLSDLGNSSYNPRGAIFYNLSCILTGIALFPFFIGFYKWHTKVTWRKISIMITQAVGCAATFALIMIGVFSDDSGWLHSLWSEVFFLLNMIVPVLAGASLYTHPRYIRGVGFYGFIVAATNLFFLFGSNTPIRVVHRFHSPRIRWIVSLQHDQTAAEFRTSSLERKDHRSNPGENSARDEITRSPFSVLDEPA